MAGYLVFLTLAAVACKVHSQPCGPVLLPPLQPCPPPCAPPPCAPAPCAPPPCLPPPCLPPPCLPPPCLPPPCLPPPCLPPCLPPPCASNVQVINPNPHVTTIIDNTVSNALVNALQLLIVSNLIGSVAGPVLAPPPLFNNLGPLLESLTCPTPCVPVEIFVPECIPRPNIEYLPCSNFEYIQPCGPIARCGPNFEFIPPCGPIIDTFPPPYCGVADVISPNFITYTETITPVFGCIDTFPPNIYNGYNEICPIYGIETYGPNFCGLPEIIAPNYYPIPEICPIYGGFPETVSPGTFAPNMFGGLTEMVSSLPPYPIYGGFPEVGPFGPLATFSPNYFGGLTEVVSQVPLATEVVIPSAIPTQLTCNFGYTPSSLPCVRVNVEPLPYEPCLCNGYGGPYFY